MRLARFLASAGMKFENICNPALTDGKYARAKTYLEESLADAASPMS
jgi:hypothetical protein